MKVAYTATNHLAWEANCGSIEKVIGAKHGPWYRCDRTRISILPSHPEMQLTESKDSQNRRVGGSGGRMVV